MDEMFRCIAFLPDPRRPELARPLLEDDIEEVATRIALRQEVLDLHLGFSLAGSLSTLASPARASAPTSQSMSTSHV
jgi:hypothetical protein